MHLARPQRTVPVACTTFLMLISEFRAVGIEGDALVSTALLGWRWMDAVRLCDMGWSCVSSED